jgi:hypothetical protein
MCCSSTRLSLKVPPGKKDFRKKVIELLVTANASFEKHSRGFMKMTILTLPAK